MYCKFFLFRLYLILKSAKTSTCPQKSAFYIWFDSRLWNDASAAVGLYREQASRVWQQQSMKAVRPIFADSKIQRGERLKDWEEPKYSKQSVRINTVDASTLLPPTPFCSNQKHLPTPSSFHFYKVSFFLSNFCILLLPFLVTLYLVWSWFVFGFVGLPFHAMLYFTLDTWAPLSQVRPGSRWMARLADTALPFILQSWHRRCWPRRRKGQIHGFRRKKNTWQKTAGKG